MPSKKTPKTEAENGKSAKRRKEWHVPMSAKCQRTTNPIRAIIERITKQKRDPIPGKPVIPLSLGDPTAFGNLAAPHVLNAAIVRLVSEHTHNGYGGSAGLEPARAAIASRYSSPNCNYGSDDVIIASGCSGALEIAITGLLCEGDNLLVPRPGFPLYQVLAESSGAQVKHYDLLPESNWEVDVAQLEALVDGKTRAVVINNPSNPCGSVYSEAHLRALLAIADRHKLPVIADEIYGEMTFGENTFHPLAELSTSVPVITVGGLAKQFVVPGWRVGWLMLYDPIDCLTDLRDGYNRLTQLIVGANTLIQGAIPAVLTPPEGSADAVSLAADNAHYVGTLETNAKYTYGRLLSIPGLRPVEPQGAMYVMVGYDPQILRGIRDDADFTDKLLSEEAVFVLPGQCFGVANFFRVVYSGPQAKLADAFDRLEAFCKRHATPYPVDAASASATVAAAVSE
jgi:tyrosine aminotransferase